LGGGHPFAEQALAAVDFFRNDNVPGINKNALVIGQSLGGGLAGYVAKIFGLEARLFNHMAFEFGVDNMHRLLTADPNDIQAIENIVNDITAAISDPKNPIFELRLLGCIHFFADQNLFSNQDFY